MEELENFLMFKCILSELLQSYGGNITIAINPAKINYLISYDVIDYKESIGFLINVTSKLIINDFK